MMKWTRLFPATLLLFIAASSLPEVAGFFGMNQKQSQEERRRSIENAVTKALKEARDQAAQELRKSVAAAKASREAAIISAREEAARGKISLSFACFIFFVWSVVVAIGTIRLWDRQQSAIHAKKSEERIKEEAKLAAEGRARIEELDEKLKVQTSRAESLVEQTKAAQEEVISALKAEHTAAVEALKAQHHKELRGANEGFQEALAASNIETKSASEASEAKVKERIQAAVAEAAAEAERKAVHTALREKEKAVQEARVKASLEAKDAAKLAENAKATAVREALAKAEADASASSDSKDQLEAAEVKHLEAIDALKKELQAKAESDSKTMAKDLTAARQKVQELEKQLEAANRKTQKVEAALHEVEDDLQQLKTNASSGGAATESSASSSLHASGATVAAASSLSSAEASDAWDPRQSGLTPSASWKATIARPGVFRTVVLQDMGAESSNPFVYTGTVNKEGEPHGKGEARFSNNDCYDGEFDNGTWHGAGTYKYASGDAEVSRYDNGNLVKEGVRWSPERTTAWKMKDGKILKKSGFGFGGKEVEITLAEAAKIAEDLGVNVPAIEVIDMNVKANGDLPFRYTGPVNASGQPHGKRGTIKWSDGERYIGGVHNGQRHGHGVMLLKNRDVYDGEYFEGARHGVGTYLFSKSGNAEVGKYDNGTPVGEGARWNKTRNAACSVYDGNKGKPMSLDEAAALATRLGVPVPAAHHST